MLPNTALSPVMLSSELPRNPTYPPPTVKVGYTGRYIKYVSRSYPPPTVKVVQVDI